MTTKRNEQNETKPSAQTLRELMAAVDAIIPGMGALVPSEKGKALLAAELSSAEMIVEGARRAAERKANVRPMRKNVGALAGTQDWYLVLSPRGKEIAVRECDLAGREAVAGPYETKSQAMCERGNR